MKKWIPAVSGAVVGILAATVFFADFNAGPKTAANDANKSNAEKVYVPLGEKDEYYLFASGGHSGQIFIYGVPSMRQIRTVPYSTPDPATGYGFDEAYEKNNGRLYMGRSSTTRHISETNGDYNGKWMFATDVANSRAAVMDLKTFTTKDIIKVPNTSGPHCAAVCNAKYGVYVLTYTFCCSNWQYI